MQDLARGTAEQLLNEGGFLVALHDHDELTMRVFATAVDMVGIAIASVVNVLDVGLVVVGAASIARARLLTG